MSLKKIWLYAALVTALCGAVALGWYLKSRDALGRPSPPMQPRYETAGMRLKWPPTVSPTEEYLTPDGGIVYLTYEQFRAANIGAALPIAGYDKKLAAAYAEPDPDKQARMLADIIDSTPKSEEGDATALALFSLVWGVLTAPPQTPARVEAKARVDEAIGCRFIPQGKLAEKRIPPCKSRASLLPTYIALAASGAPLLFALVATLLRRKNRTTSPAGSGEKPKERAAG